MATKLIVFWEISMSIKRASGIFRLFLILSILALFVGCGGGGGGGSNDIKGGGESND